jgi:hypothetical protein
MLPGSLLFFHERASEQNESIVSRRHSTKVQVLESQPEQLLPLILDALFKDLSFKELRSDSCISIQNNQ